MLAIYCCLTTSEIYVFKTQDYGFLFFQNSTKNIEKSANDSKIVCRFLCRVKNYVKQNLSSTLKYKVHLCNLKTVSKTLSAGYLKTQQNLQTNLC